MQIALLHGTERAAAIKKIDEFLDGLAHREFPGGVKINAVKREWDGGRLRLALRTERGSIEKEIVAKIVITERHVLLDSELPRMITSFANEETVHRAVENQLCDIFGIERQ